MRYLNIDERKMLYNSCIASRLAYADAIWTNTTEALKNRLQVIQNDAARAILFKKPRTSAEPLLKELNWINLRNKRRLHCEVLFHKIVNGAAPKSLHELLERYSIDNNDGPQRRRNEYFIPSYRTNAMADSFYITTLKTWREIPSDLKLTKEPLNFKARLNNHYSSQFRCHEK